MILRYAADGNRRTFSQIIREGFELAFKAHFESGAEKGSVSVGAREWREQSGALGAYYLRADGASAFPETVTIVNVMRNVLRYYFGADLPPLPNDIYFSLPDRPYAFTRVSGDEKKAP